ncbi:TfoX/Sxy family protein [Sinomicrobium kalidii]|uniref:TfoX/Sxy family protein n=1 Tax=Sinomicrobium kalidii TaxID=2900738 RepID=UPI001E56F118|nr:TfoX/Sxy family protein [Sinomicrobium kalidii]UGU16004.1 TfoX/Sxy family protein [Sinomicrobium kalidii]
MAYSEQLATRIRQALAHLPDVEEKKMFGGIAFMVNDKMCLTVSKNKMMCRIDPEIHDTVLEKGGCETVIMKGREYRGYVDVGEDSLGTEAVFNYWVNLALDFNKRAKPSRKRKK